MRIKRVASSVLLVDGHAASRIFKHMLREFIRLTFRSIISEKIRGNFDVRKLKELDNLKDVFKYAKDNLELIGSGSSRLAFLLSSQKVIKVAKNSAGIGQNSAEVEIYTNPKARAVLAKIYDYGEGYKWIISELVRPILRPGEFKSLTGIPFSGFQAVLDDFASAKTVTDIDDIIDYYFNSKVTKRRNFEQRAADWVRDIGYTLFSTDLKVGDFYIIEHWGKTASGRVVLLDYGFTEEIYKFFYKKYDMSGTVET